MRRLVLIRHAIAVPRGTPGVSEAGRPLTPRGRERFRRAAAGLARILPPPDVLLTSPLERAAATARIAARAWGRIRLKVERSLATGSVEGVLGAIDRAPDGALVAAVGHEPHLSRLLADLVGSGDPGRLAFRKGGAALVEIPGGARSGGRLVWHLPPRLLRRLARG